MKSYKIIMFTISKIHNIHVNFNNNQTPYEETSFHYDETITHGQSSVNRADSMSLTLEAKRA